MAEPHVVSALVRKRAELAGEIEAAEKRATRLRTDLAHLDATLRLFKPDADPAAGRPRRPAQCTGYFRRGTLARACLDLLRRQGGPLSTRELALRVLAGHGVAARGAGADGGQECQQGATGAAARRGGAAAGAGADGAVVGGRVK